MWTIYYGIYIWYVHVRALKIPYLHTYYISMALSDDDQQLSLSQLKGPPDCYTD